MKFLFKVLFCFLFVVVLNRASSETFFSEYSVSTSGIKIGELSWNLIIDQKNYSLEIKLNNTGFLSGLFSFKGSYITDGSIRGGSFFPNSYIQNWETRNKKRGVELFFKDNKIIKLRQSPKEEEVQRISIEDLSGYYDPLTSILRLLKGLHESKTIDGRRIYTVSINENTEQKNKRVYFIKNYKNIWADHKRNDLEQIIIKNSSGYLPDSININFKGQLFKVEKI